MARSLLSEAVSWGYVALDSVIPGRRSICHLNNQLRKPRHQSRTVQVYEILHLTKTVKIGALVVQ